MDERERLGEPVVTTTTTGHAQHETGRSAGTLISEALTHMSTLVRKEFDLARAEVSQNFNRALVAVGLIVGAVVFALTSLIVLAGALTAALAEFIEEGWAALIVAVVFAIIAAIMASKGANDLKASSLAPTRTAENLRKDKDAVKESL